MDKKTKEEYDFLRHCLCSRKNEAKELLDKGVSIETKTDSFGYTALVTAARSNNIEMFKFLLENGADPNTTFSDDEMPILTYCIFKKRIEYVRILLDFGADIKKEDVYGLTPIDQSKSLIDKSIFDLLNNYTEKGE